MWMTELATNTITADTRIGSQSAVKPVMKSSSGGVVARFWEPRARASMDVRTRKRGRWLDAARAFRGQRRSDAIAQGLLFDALADRTGAAEVAHRARKRDRGVFSFQRCVEVAQPSGQLRALLIDEVELRIAPRNRRGIGSDFLVDRRSNLQQEIAKLEAERAQTRAGRGRRAVIYGRRHSNPAAAAAGTPKMRRKIGSSSPTVYPALETPTHRFRAAMTNQNAM